jgi:alkanesulfonate monooxygenase SsuD/methylene tetrahydromethanopterin reductase-like flavin-dependent oxidoreductase (luciferase family)
MDVGLAIFMQNYRDYARHFEVRDQGSKNFVPEIPDSEIYSVGLRLGKLAEPLGFDSIWTVEHHFTPYTMVPDPIRLLSYFAACTERINMGTMVVVLPWHDPIRAAEDIANLDLLLEGRKFYPGVGRGAAKIEFDGLRIPQGESRTRFAESVEIIRLALSGKAFSYEGKHFKIPELEIRPKPRSDPQELLDRMHMAWGAAESMPIAAQMGLKPLINPQRSWADYINELTEFHDIRKSAGYDPAAATCASWVICAPTAAEAEQKAGKHFWELADATLRHYNLISKNFENLKGYEYYARRAKALLEVDDPVSAMADMYKNLYVWGTPQMCFEKLSKINDMITPREILCTLNWGTMSSAEAEASMRLFAIEVIPAAKKLPDRPIVGTVKRDGDLPLRGGLIGVR